MFGQEGAASPPTAGGDTRRCGARVSPASVVARCGGVRAAEPAGRSIFAPLVGALAAGPVAGGSLGAKVLASGSPVWSGPHHPGICGLE